MGIRKPTPKTLVQQCFALKRRFPKSVCSVKRDVLIWHHLLKPGEICQAYQVSMEYRLTSSPSVFVIAPKLQERNGEQPPHLYRDGSLCLYYPKAQEWRPHMFLSDTIVPWAAEWLFYYEVWFSTGSWLGGGIHPK